jgi:hypothetical protein
LCVSFEFFDHGGRWGNTAQALARWRHPVASSESLDVLYQAMCPASYRRVCMAIKIARDSTTLFVVVDSLLSFLFPPEPIAVKQLNPYLGSEKFGR